MLVALRPPVRFTGKQRSSEAEFALLEPRFHPHTVFMEIGAADCKLALRAASYVERVYAIDVSGQFLHNVLVPCNVRLVLCDGVHLPVPAGAVNVAWGGAFMDHLHPQDAAEHLRHVWRSLVPGGEYLCTTRRSPIETAQRVKAAGFSEVRYYARGARVPGGLSSLIPQNLLRIAAIK